MAKIEMDVSEYEAMKKTERLLEESLENERGLREEIESLKQEKIEALEKAKMQVIKRSEVVTTEHIMVRCWDNPEELVFRIFKSLDLDTAQCEYVFSRMQHTPRSYLIKLVEDIYKVETSVSGPITEETIFKGLDEVKKEIRDTLEEKYKKDIQESKEIREKHSDFLSQMDKLKDTVTQTKEMLKDERKKNDQLKIELEATEDLSTYKEKVEEIQTVFKQGYGLFGKKAILDQTLEILNRKL